MFHNQTTFVLGAGASWHYGFPTGEDLVAEVVAAANLFDQYLQLFQQFGDQFVPDFVTHCCEKGAVVSGIAEGFREARRLSAEIKNRLLAADPLVIDYFLGHNQELGDVGRFLIAWVLHARESKAALAGFNVNRPASIRGRDNWSRFIVSRLTNGCRTSAELLENRANFVTFNYDLSLERALFRGLNSLSRFKQDDVDKFLAGDRIVHVYGSVSELDSQQFSIFDSVERFIQNPSTETIARDGLRYLRLMNFLWGSGQGLKVIDPEHKLENERQLDGAREHIWKSQCIYILGYGFDENNNHRIGLDKLAEQRSARNLNQSVLFTNFENSNRVSKRAGRTLVQRFNVFLDLPIIGNPGSGTYFEMSVKDTYDALSLDFDDLEETLLPDSPI